MTSSSVCVPTCVCVFFFFFSSRRRHTRFDCDWSSDVCSSDLAGVRPPLARRALAESGGSVRVAIVMARYGLSRRRAARVLRDAGGTLRGVLQRPRRKELTRKRTGPSLKAKRSQPKGSKIAAAGRQNAPLLHNVCIYR